MRRVKNAEETVVCLCLQCGGQLERERYVGVYV